MAKKELKWRNKNVLKNVLKSINIKNTEKTVASSDKRNGVLTELRHCTKKNAGIYITSKKPK